MTRRLVASYLALAVFVFVMLAVPFARSTISNERDRLRNGLERDAVVLASAVEDVLAERSANTAAVARRVADAYRIRTGARVVITDAGGTAIADNDPPTPGERSFRTRPEVIAALSSRVGFDERYSATLRHRAMFVAVPVSSGGRLYGAVRVSVTTRQIDQRIRSHLRGLLVASLIALASAAVLAVFLARWLTRPIALLRRTANRIGTGDMAARAETRSGPPELRDLAIDLNTMASRLQELISAQDAFVADASHQLRTPLTAARLRLEAIEFSSETRREEHRLAALDEVMRLSRTVDGLLELARAERAPSAVEELDIAAVVDERIDHWSALAAERSVVIVRRGETRLFARATHDRVVQVLDNVLANAIDATLKQTGVLDLPLIEVLVGPDDEMIEIVIRDSGPGMSDREFEHAFDRFWRARSDRTDLSGSGLGLSIVRKLILADAGTVELRRSPSGGVDVVIHYRGPRA